MQFELGKIHNVDARVLLGAMESGSVDLVVCDPPYMVDYAEWDKGFGRDIIEECRRVSNGAVFAFGGAHPRSMKAYLDCEPDRCLIWNPRFLLRANVTNGIAYRWHPIWAWDLPEKTSVLSWDVLDDMQQGHHWWDHPATKPESLIAKLVGECREGGVVLDPYMGSGTTAVVCEQYGRRWIGSELEPQYIEIGNERLKRQRAQGVLDFDQRI